MLLRISVFNKIFHYLPSVLTLGASVCFIYGGITLSDDSEDILLNSGIIFFIVGSITLYRDVEKLRFRSIELNGFDKEEAIQIFTNILNDNRWHIRTSSEDKIVAYGSRFDNNKHTFLLQEKMLTVLFSNDSVLINCIIEPPVSFRWSYSLNKRIVNNFINDFLHQCDIECKLDSSNVTHIHN